MRFQPARVPARLRLWSLSEDVLVENGPDRDHLVALTQWGEIRIDDTSQLVRESLRRMSLGPVSVENLPLLGDSFQLWRSGRTGAEAEPWYRLRRVLELVGCCVVQSLGLDDEIGPVLSVAPVSRQAGFWLPPEVDVNRPVRLSRFVAGRACNGELLLESPLARYRVVLHRPMAAWVVGSMSAPTSIAQLTTLLQIPTPVVTDIVAYLIGSGMVLTAEPGAPARFAEDHDPALIAWSHHDLRFHAYSRMGVHSGQPVPEPIRAGQPLIAPLPEPELAPNGLRFTLYRPALADLLAADPPLTEVIEARGPHRDYSERPLTARQLGELLFRAAAIRGDEFSQGTEPAETGPPGGAVLHELELYVSLNQCTGLPSGSYHYDPREHTLTMVNDSESELFELLDTAKVAAGSTQRPPVLISVSTRIARVSWLHGESAYSTTLKHVGALQQSLYLAAAAMGLASCALAVSDGAAADEALRFDWPTEVGVGEFIVGVRS